MGRDIIKGLLVFYLVIGILSAAVKVDTKSPGGKALAVALLGSIPNALLIWGALSL